MLRIFLFFTFFVSLSFSQQIIFKNFTKDSLNDKELTEYVMSEKKDGIRGVWDGKTLKSKRGKPLFAPANFLKSLPSFSLDGELWLSYQSIEKTANIVLDKIPNNAQWDEITYFVFDAPSLCESCTLLERVEILQKKLKNNKRVKVIPQIPIKNRAHLESYFQEIVQKGGEGLILRNNKKPFIAYKYKPYCENKCKITGYTKGKKEGQIGAILCKAMIKGKEKIIKIGSGLSVKNRENPPQIGSLIAYKHNGYTKNDLPRFPVFLKIESLE